jgi:hypothetical protein
MPYEYIHTNWESHESHQQTIKKIIINDLILFDAKEVIS